MGKPKAPAAPDYAAAAAAQGDANVNAAISTNFLNQANQVNPYGSLNYSYDQQGGYTLPNGTVIPRTTVTTTLSPEQQKLYDQNTQMSTSLNDLALKGIGYVDQASSNPIDQSTLPSLKSGLAAPTFDGNLDRTQFQNSYDFAGASAAPQIGDFAGQRDKITEAMMQRLQPYLNKQREMENTRMANQGITMGSEAWKWDQDTLNRGENDQRIAALLAGDTAQQNLFSNAMNLRNQGTQEAIAQGNIFNQAAEGNFAQGLAAGNFSNQAKEATFNTGLASNQFQNQARSQAIQEADYFKNQPLNMLNALRSGNQTTMPQFGNVTAGSSIGAAPVYAAANDQYSAAMEAYKAKMASYSGMLSGITGIGTAFATGGLSLGGAAK